jgi:hypothetical protein
VRRTPPGFARRAKIAGAAFGAGLAAAALVALASMASLELAEAVVGGGQLAPRERYARAAEGLIFRPFLAFFVGLVAAPVLAARPEARARARRPAPGVNLSTARVRARARRRPPLRVASGGGPW